PWFLGSSCTQATVSKFGKSFKIASISDAGNGYNLSTAINKIELFGFLAKCSFKSINILPDAKTTFLTASLSCFSVKIGSNLPEVNLEIGSETVLLRNKLFGDIITNGLID